MAKKRGAQIERLIQEILIIQEMRLATFSRTQIEEAFASEGMEVKVRTLQRDLETLVEVGILELVENQSAKTNKIRMVSLDHSRELAPVDAEPSGFAAAAGNTYKLAFKRVTAAKRQSGQNRSPELLLLYHFAIQQVLNFKGTDTGRFCDDVVARMKGQLREDDQADFKAIEKSVYVHSRFKPSRSSQSLLKVIMVALPGRDGGDGSGKQLEFNYKKPGQKSFEKRVIEPHFVYISDYGTYVVGRDVGKDQKPFRCYGLGRILGVKVLNQTWSGEVETPQNYFANRFGVMRGSMIEDIKLVFRPELSAYIQEREWHRSQQARELEDGSLELCLKVAVTKDLIQWVAYFGPDVVVEKGDTLRAGLLKFLEEAVERNLAVTAKGHKAS